MRLDTQLGGFSQQRRGCVKLLVGALDLSASTVPESTSVKPNGNRQTTIRKETGFPSFRQIEYVDYGPAA